MSKCEYFKQSDLRDRGWTASMQKRLLGEPDKTACNPIYKSASPMKLYAKSKVNAAEATLEFARLKLRAERNRQKMMPSVQARKQATIDAVKSQRIKLKMVSLEHCQREALKFYAEMNDDSEFGDFEDVKTRNPEFLDRITVNHIRHNRTAYDQLLAEQTNKIGVNAARETVRAMVYKAIMTAYPELTDECRRQLAARDCDINLAA